MFSGGLTGCIRVLVYLCNNLIRPGRCIVFLILSPCSFTRKCDRCRRSAKNATTSQRRSNGIPRRKFLAAHLDRSHACSAGKQRSKFVLWRRVGYSLQKLPPSQRQGEPPRRRHGFEYESNSLNYITGSGDNIMLGLPAQHLMFLGKFLLQIPCLSSLVKFHTQCNAQDFHQLV